jgi:hypothetical protein
MGLKYNEFGDECESTFLGKREEIRMGKTDGFRQSCFCMNNKHRTGKKSFGAGTTMEVNYGAFLELLKTKESVCHA